MTTFDLTRVVIDKRCGKSSIPPLRKCHKPIDLSAARARGREAWPAYKLWAGRAKGNYALIARLALGDGPKRQAAFRILMGSHAPSSAYRRPQASLYRALGLSGSQSRGFIRGFFDGLREAARRDSGFNRASWQELSSARSRKGWGMIRRDPWGRGDAADSAKSIADIPKSILSRSMIWNLLSKDSKRVSAASRILSRAAAQGSEMAQLQEQLRQILGVPVKDLGGQMLLLQSRDTAARERQAKASREREHEGMGRFAPTGIDDR